MSERGVGIPEAVGLGYRFFAAPAGQPRARRGTDVVLLVPAALGPALAIAVYPPSSLEQSLESFLAALPGWLGPVWGFLADLLWLWALVLVVIALVRGRLVVAAQAGAALVLGALLALCAARLATGSWPGSSTRSSARPTRRPSRASALQKRWR